MLTLRKRHLERYLPSRRFRQAALFRSIDSLHVKLCLIVVHLDPTEISACLAEAKTDAV